MTGLVAVASFWLGSSLGALVTLRAERRPWWGERLGRSRFRRAHLPIIGPPIILCGIGLALAGLSLEATATLGLGVGATVQAPLLGYMSPLPPDFGDND